jgi:serine/threonine protein kinase
VLDDRLSESGTPERWFVMELFKTSLDKEMGRYKGRVLEALRAFEPIVQAVAELHNKGIVHRDIKPDNVFIAADGHLVLGDCGLAIKLEEEDRITMTFENVGTRDYQPPWSYGMRLEDVRPTFDVFSLAKLLWAMVSGRPRMPLWYFDEEPHDLRTIFSDNSDVPFVHRILKKCVVQREERMNLKDAGALLDEVDRSIAALESGGQLPSMKRKMRCKFCGLGMYTEHFDVQVPGLDQKDIRYGFKCGLCGHVDLFLWSGRKTPEAWQE